jgi:hypothetical protein
MEDVAPTIAAAMLYSQHGRELRTMDTKCIIEIVYMYVSYERFSYYTHFISIYKINHYIYARANDRKTELITIITACIIVCTRASYSERDN